ncbi:MAG: YqaA family protein [Gemmobacter sp.]|jgi:membrane protein YqaA with SNARE-associated domain
MGAWAELGGLFAAAFLSATLLPGSSEVVLIALVQGAGGAEAAAAVAVASIGNTLGAVVTWGIGRGLAGAGAARMSEGTRARLARAEAWHRRLGVWSLLLSWVPVVGDPIVLLAGVLRTPFWPFLILVAAGKTARYGALAALAAG